MGDRVMALARFERNYGMKMEIGLFLVEQLFTYPALFLQNILLARFGQGLSIHKSSCDETNYGQAHWVWRKNETSLLLFFIAHLFQRSSDRRIYARGTIHGYITRGAQFLFDLYIGRYMFLQAR